MAGPGRGGGRGRSAGGLSLVASEQTTNEGGAVAPSQRRFSLEDRASAMRLLLEDGLSFPETQAALPFAVSIGTLHNWYVRALATMPATEGGARAGGGPGGGGSSALESAFSAKRQSLKMKYLLAAESLADAAVSLGLAGAGKDSQGCMMASAIAFDKAQLLDGRPTQAKYGRWDMVHSTAAPIAGTPDDRQRLIAAARVGPGESDVQFINDNPD